MVIIKNIIVVIVAKIKDDSAGGLDHPFNISAVEIHNAPVSTVAAVLAK